MEVKVEEGPGAAVERAREMAGPDGLVVATGSLYLVGRLLPLFKNPEDNPGENAVTGVGR